jgi:hypothetical protein
MYPTRRCREHRWLAANPREAVVFLPMEPSMERPERECLRLYGSTLHFTPMVNGYSTSLPSGYRATAGILNGWPSAEADSVLDRIGVDCIVYEDGSEIDADTAIDADTVFSDGRIYVSVISRRPGP